MFSVRGLELAIEVLEEQIQIRCGRCLVFMPESCLDMAAVGAKKRAQKAGYAVNLASLPDNVSLLQAWQREWRLVTTPSSDYDDLYVVEFVAAR